MIQPSSSVHGEPSLLRASLFTKVDAALLPVSDNAFGTQGQGGHSIIAGLFAARLKFRLDPV